MTNSKTSAGLSQKLPSLIEVDAELATRKLRHFIRLGWPEAEPARAYLNNWHMDAIADHLQAVTEGEIQQLLINVPPGHAKSLVVSVMWPAWVWTRNPGWRSIFSSYAADLAMRDSVRCRGVIESEWYQTLFRPQWNLSRSQNAKSWFENTVKGFRLSLGVGGKATGFRGDALVVDDPLNAKEQHSDAALEEAVFWWDQVMSSRLNDLMTGAKVIIMQRLSERDLAAHVLAQGGYEHLNLPSEFELESRAKTSLQGGWMDPRTEPGQLLFPSLFPQEALDKAKRSLGAQGFAAQHQQRPSPAEGGLFKRHHWNYWQPAGMDLGPVIVKWPDGSFHEIDPVKLPEKAGEYAQSWDFTFKDVKSSDYVAGQVWARAGADRFLIDQCHERLDFVRSVDAMRAMVEKHPRTFLKLVEDKANGSAVISTLKHDIAGIVAVNPEGGKYARASAVSPQIESGNVYLPHPKLYPWVGGFIDECAAFPNGAHDDQVDAMSQMLLRWGVGAEPRIRIL